MSTVFLFIAMLGNAQAKKEKKEASSEANPSENQVKANVPNDSNSKKFAKHLFSTEFTNFSPEGDGFEYTKLRFKKDNTWAADAAIILDDEEMDCIESGTWSMEAAQSVTTAALTWKITATDCPAREAGGTIRIIATLDGQTIDAKYR